MKREIEFRGKTAKGEWVYGSFINSVVKGSPFGYIAGNNVVEPIQVMRKTVGQYVGIKDKNGKKLYEGDILKVDRELELWENKKQHETFYGVVEYDEENTQFVINGEKYKNMSIFIRYNISYEVIGNIFDKESDNGD